MSAHAPKLGIIEGFFGPLWPWADRTFVLETAAAAGFAFYHYAPKNDPFLRRRWMEPHPRDWAEQLASFTAKARTLGVSIGVGLSPYNAFRDFDATAREALARRVKELEALGFNELAILFDDMNGDLPDLAQKQVEILDFVGQKSNAQRLIMCPSYYTSDGVLDRVFGPRPPNYLKDLGRNLDPKIEVYWTGEEVCARAISPGHISEVAETLRRKPLIWDNYPVNDGPRMSPYLHLRGFTGRGPGLAAMTSGHAVNPALQPTLSLIPILTLADAYRLGDDYQYMDAFDRAAAQVCGLELAAMLRRDLLSFQDAGLPALADRLDKIRARYQTFDHPAAREVLAWLDGAYATSLEEVQTQ